MGKTYIRISFEKDTSKAKVTKLVFEGDERKDKLKFFTDSIGARVFDIFAYDEEIDLIIDDEGTFISGNPVFKLPIERYGGVEIVGSFLIGKKNETSDGAETVGFEDEDEVRAVLQGFVFSLVGFMQ